MSKTLFGYAIDKNLDDFKEIAKNLQANGQISRSTAILYLIERCRIAEEERDEMFRLYSSSTK